MQPIDPPTLKLKWNASDKKRLAFLHQRLGITRDDEIVRYALAQVTWWCLSGPNADKVEDDEEDETVMAGAGRGIG
jgi:hypothetical protein